MKKNRMIALIGSIIISIFSAELSAQEYNYSYHVSNSPFTSLNDSTKSIIDNSVWDDNTYTVPIGFELEFAGQRFNSLKIMTNGTIAFDEDNKYNFVALYKDFICETDDQNHSQSPISKELLTLPDGTKRLVIEFINAAFIQDDGTKNHISFQIWLNQKNNSIELHIGEMNTIINDGCLVGILNINAGENDSTIGYLLQGNQSSHSSAAISKAETPSNRRTIPNQGTVYTFTPTTH